MAGSSGVRSALFGTLLLVAGSRGLGKLVRMAGVAVALVRGATALAGLVRK